MYHFFFCAPLHLATATNFLFLYGRSSFIFCCALQFFVVASINVSCLHSLYIGVCNNIEWHLQEVSCEAQTPVPQMVLSFSPLVTPCLFPSGMCLALLKNYGHVIKSAQCKR